MRLDKHDQLALGFRYYNWQASGTRVRARPERYTHPLPFLVLPCLFRLYLSLPLALHLSPRANERFSVQFKSIAASLPVKWSTCREPLHASGTLLPPPSAHRPYGQLAVCRFPSHLAGKLYHRAATE